MNMKAILTNILIKRGYSPINTSNSIIIYNNNVKVEVSYTTYNLNLLITTISNTNSTIQSLDIDDFNLTSIRTKLLDLSLNKTNISTLNSTYIDLANIIEEFLLCFNALH